VQRHDPYVQNAEEGVENDMKYQGNPDRVQRGNIKIFKINLFQLFGKFPEDMLEG
jgi:hypothetical protein